MKISDNTAISMPVRNLIAILLAVAAGVWSYSEITTRLITLETSEQLMKQALSDIEKLKDKQREFANGNGH